MKAEMKAVVASLVVIALALTAVSGITYSWFSDEEKAQIEVTTGNIALNMDGSLSVAVYEYGKVEPISTITPEPVSGTYTFNVVNLKDNDTIKVSVPEITIDNTIDVKYYEKIVIKEGESETTEFFTVTGLNSGAKAISAGASDKSVAAHEISILFDSDNRGMDKNYSISISFIAIQANAPIEISGADLSGAIDSASSGSILKLTTSASVSTPIIIDKDITLDLSFVSPVTTYAADSEAGIVIKSTATIMFEVDGGSLTIIGGTIECVKPYKAINGSSVAISGTIINSSGYAVSGMNSKDYSATDVVTLTDVTMKTTGAACIGTLGNTQLTITGGSYESDFGAAIVTNGNSNNDGQGYSISDAKFTVTTNGIPDYDNKTVAVGIQCHNNESMSITNCKFDITNGVGISVRGGDVGISGCTFTSTGSVNGQLQYTDNKIDVESGHFIAVSYTDGSYGCDENTKLTIDGVVINSVSHDSKSVYFEYNA